MFWVFLEISTFVRPSVDGLCFVQRTCPRVLGSEAGNDRAPPILDRPSGQWMGNVLCFVQRTCPRVF